MRIRTSMRPASRTCSSTECRSCATASTPAQNQVGWCCGICSADIYVSIYIMKRTTIYLDPDLEILLKLEAMKSGRSAVEVLREALRAYFQGRPAKLPAGAGSFDSGYSDTAERAEEILA